MGQFLAAVHVSLQQSLTPSPLSSRRKAGDSNQRSKHEVGNAAGREKVWGEGVGHEMVGLQNTAVSKRGVPNDPDSYHELHGK